MSPAIISHLWLNVFICSERQSTDVWLTTRCTFIVHVDTLTQLLRAIVSLSHIHTYYCRCLTVCLYVINKISHFLYPQVHRSVSSSAVPFLKGPYVRIGQLSNSSSIALSNKEVHSWVLPRHFPEPQSSVMGQILIGCIGVPSKDPLSFYHSSLCPCHLGQSRLCALVSFSHRHPVTDNGRMYWWLD